MSVGAKPIVINLDAFSKTLVTGRNGGGKSTILEAITFALFGKPFRNIKKGQLVNSINKKAMLVELWMEYDNHSFYIKRGLKPNIFEIELDGVRLDESASVKDFQEYFENLVGMNYSSFKQVAVLGTAGYTPFMGLSTPNRRKLIEDLLEVSTLAEMDKINKAQIREINSKISLLDVQKDNLVQQIKIYKDNADKQNRLSGENVNRLKTMYDDLAKEARSHKANIDNLNDRLIGIVCPDSDLSESKQITSQKIYGINRDINQINNVISLYKQGGDCPTCHQHLIQNDDLMISLSSKTDELQTSLGRLNSHLELINTELNEAEANRKTVLEIKTKISQEKESAISAVEKARKVKLLIDKAQSEMIDYSKEIKKLNTEHDKIIKDKTDAVMEKYHRGILTDMLKDSGIKGAIIKKYIPLFNKQINHYLKIMDADYVFTLDEEFNETIKSRGREDFSYASFSQGEKARIDIAILFTWKDVAERVSGVKISTLMLDEVFDGPADSECIKNIGIILSNLKDTNTFIISHRDHDPQTYGQHLKMKKVGRFTVLE